MGLLKRLLIILIISTVGFIYFAEKKSQEMLSDSFYTVAITYDKQMNDKIAAQIAAEKARLAEELRIIRIENAIAMVKPYMHSDTKRTIAVNILSNSRRHRIDPLLLLSIIWTESEFNPNATSYAGARGLMQVMPFHFRSVNRCYSISANIETGSRIYASYRRMFKRDSTALAAYNAGPGAVIKYGGIPQYRETQHYVRRVMKRYKILTQNFT
jgi:soluble lytic murein transglycosylase-like protein